MAKLFDDQLARNKTDYPWARKFIQAMWDNPWNVEEFNFASDIQDFKTKLTEQEKEIVVRALSAISQIEHAIKQYWAKLGDTLPPMRDLGSVMANVETVHNYAYEKLLDELNIYDIFEKNLNESVIAGRVKYLRKYTHRYYTDSKKQFIYSLILFTLFVENVSLFSQFYIMNWIHNNRNVLKKVNQQILYTKNEENIHALVGITITNELRKEYPELFDEDLKVKIVTEAKEAIEHEVKIVQWILGDFTDKKISVDILRKFLTYRMDKSLFDIGFGAKPIVSDEDREQFWWFEEEIMATNLVDFFSQRPADYAKNTADYSPESLFD